jgi:hypothetical protein
MSVRIFKDKNTGDFAVQTTCLNAEAFIVELSDALSQIMKRESDPALASYGVLKTAAPIMFKLSGYKADEVSEQRTLLCGVIYPDASDMIASAGKS